MNGGTDEEFAVEQNAARPNSKCCPFGGVTRDSTTSLGGRRDGSGIIARFSKFASDPDARWLPSILDRQYVYDDVGRARERGAHWRNDRDRQRWWVVQFVRLEQQRGQWKWRRVLLRLLRDYHRRAIGHHRERNVFGHRLHHTNFKYDDRGVNDRGGAAIHFEWKRQLQRDCNGHC